VGSWVSTVGARAHDATTRTAAPPLQTQTSYGWDPGRYFEGPIAPRLLSRMRRMSTGETYRTKP